MKSIYTVVVLCISKPTTQICMEYSFQVWTGTLHYNLGLLDKLKIRVYSVFGPTLAASFKPKDHGCDLASLNLIEKYFFAIWSSELAGVVRIPSSYG